MALTGKIIKGIAGFYYVHTGSGIYECHARGIFRKECRKPLAGDDVMIDVTDEPGKIGSICEILPRRNSLIRPAVANIDQAVVIFSIHRPEPVWDLLDRFILMMGYADIKSYICINKDDLSKQSEADSICSMYRGSGCKVLFTSTINGTGMDELQAVLKGKTTAVAGPSGVGKSSIINTLTGTDHMETGEISRRVERGRQTTRHTELVPIAEDTFILDSPGFSSMELPDISKEQLRFYYPEFAEYEGGCYFNGCMHVHEPDCAVKNAVENGDISRERYASYISIYEELKDKRAYR